MIINSIALKNFRSYEGETQFNFSSDKSKNIVLIGGENGAGKSTLFEAIKLCIYGPTTYGYIGKNNNYLNKIKNNINNNAFKSDFIECFISMNISFNEGTKNNTYSLKRSWIYKDQKITENFTVHLNKKELTDEEKVYFDIYLKSIIPPSLFNLFFFDGEELSDFFTGKSASANLKESVLQLFNYDTFEILKKQLLTYQRSNSKSNDKLRTVQTSYDEFVNYTNTLKEEISSLKADLNFNEEKLNNLHIKKMNIEEDFRNSGGLLEAEKMALTNEINKYDTERTNTYENIKLFCNDKLPFLLVSDLLSQTKEQIHNEEILNSYNAIEERLSPNVIKNSLQNYNFNNDNNEIYNEIAATMLSNMFDLNRINNIDNILQLSSEEKNKVLSIINDILINESSYRNDILTKYRLISNNTYKIKILREKLNSTISTDILNSYLESLSLINNEISLTDNSIISLNLNIEQKEEELKNKEYHLLRLKNEYTTLLQSSNVLDISNEVVNYLENLLLKLTEDKIKLIENEFINIFDILIRKDNYVNSIVIDEKFKTTLYINKNYDTNDIINIIKNIGFDGVSKKYGDKFLSDLYKHYNIKSSKELEIQINKSKFKNLSLSTKVNVNDFSSGEKQIYIFSLIWAIIKSSGVDIPFIIDTPYARIDESHRNTITNKYLPNISKQVIILSTNKEIDAELYPVIKPYICNEYLLLYNTELRKTEVKNGYFGV